MPLRNSLSEEIRVYIIMDQRAKRFCENKTGFRSFTNKVKKTKKIQISYVVNLVRANSMKLVVL